LKDEETGGNVHAIPVSRERERERERERGESYFNN